MPYERVTIEVPPSGYVRMLDRNWLLMESARAANSSITDDDDRYKFPAADLSHP